MERDRLVSLPHCPAPPGGTTRVLETADGRQLRTARWEPETPARGTVLLLHGYTEFIEKYYEVVERLLARGFVVVTYDHRGQGLSERLIPGHSVKGYQTDFGDLVADALRVHDDLAVTGPGPQLLLAHSMGGNVALRTLQADPERFERAVLSAPMTGFDRVPVWLMHAVARLQVKRGRGDRYTWGAGEVDLEKPQNRVTTDAERFERAMSFWRHEPALMVSGVTWRWVQEATRSIAAAARPEALDRLRTPTLVASAGRDLVVSSRSHERLARRSRWIERVLVEPAMHEILQERDEVQDRFWAHFDAFVPAREAGESRRAV